MQRLRIDERADWREQAEAQGFDFHTIDGEPYWDESACYTFTLDEIERDIEAPTQELHEMAMALVGDVANSGELMAKLGIAPGFWDTVAQSWRRRDPHLYGRMDLAYDGNGAAKLYELNYDTPTSLFEAGFFQWNWLEDQVRDGRLPNGADQYNRIQEALQERFAALLAEGKVASCIHFAATQSSREDQTTIAYLQECAHQSGIETIGLAIEDIGISADGWFTDLDDRVIRTLFKLYPLEDMFRDAFGPKLAANTMQLIEPPWKSVLSNKGILALLWERHPGHPNLLETRFAERGQTPATGWALKPIHSREGANITLALDGGTTIGTSGPYDTSLAVLQRVQPLPTFDGRYPVIGSWVVGDEAVGMGIREDASLITTDSARFLPHAILG
ncbi:glutathionylspermidine synthase family protein [Solilutibacter silvestris]|uniref:Glutathionylspermidine synthase n=1 Tax=Solilutibacter silvestris TaxID=1645665 RepID=A0A2K1Q293_9GAMM|nr:glutathionylspermidine synthase family protein [Lysobacter silvestris]PNS09165.1 Glutathionylspermidine synthase [Lysobacter silvestris]